MEGGDRVGVRREVDVLLTCSAAGRSEVLAVEEAVGGARQDPIPSLRSAVQRQGAPTPLDFSLPNYFIITFLSTYTQLIGQYI